MRLEEQDPVLEEAKRLTEITLDRVTLYGEAAKMEGDIAAQVGDGQKVLVLVDAPTSKPKVVLSLLETVGGLVKSLATQRVRVLMTASSRLDLLLAGVNKMQTTFGDGSHFTVQLVRAAKQRLRLKPAYVQLMVRKAAGGPAADIPNSIDVGGCRAKAGEYTRLRCLCEQCPLRTQEEMAAALTSENEGPFREIPEDDLAVLEDVDDLPEDGEEEEDPVVTSSELGRRLITALWPFAFPRDHYKTLYTEIGEPEATSHMVIYSTSAHPAPILAARSRPQDGDACLLQCRQGPLPSTRPRAAEKHVDGGAHGEGAGES